MEVEKYRERLTIKYFVKNYYQWISSKKSIVLPDEKEKLARALHRLINLKQAIHSDAKVKNVNIINQHGKCVNYKYIEDLPNGDRQSKMS